MGNIDKFDLMANHYDTDERIKIAKVITMEIRHLTVNCKDKDAIDYGCGTGLVGLELAAAFHSIKLIDAASNMVEQVNQKIKTLGINNAQTLCLDFEFNGTAGIRADYIIVVQTLLHIKNIEPLLRCLHETLNSGGHLIIVDFDKNDSIVSDEVHNGFELSCLIEQLRGIGFADAHGYTFYRSKQIFMNKDASLFILDAFKC